MRKQHTDAGFRLPRSSRHNGGGSPVTSGQIGFHPRIPTPCVVMLMRLHTSGSIVDAHEVAQSGSIVDAHEVAHIWILS